jgi:hypothetical protein
MTPLRVTDLRHDVGISDSQSLSGYRIIRFFVADGNDVPDHPIADVVLLATYEPGVVSNDFIVGNDYTILLKADGTVYDVQDKSGHSVYKWPEDLPAAATTEATAPIHWR